MRRACSTAIWQHLWERCCGSLWICPLAPGTSADILILYCERPQRVKGHFKDHEVCANCIALLIMLCLWKGRVFMRFSWPKCVLSLGAILGWGKKQDVPGVLAAKVVHGASTPPNGVPRVYCMLCNPVFFWL